MDKEDRNWAVSPTRGALQERETKKGASGSCVFEHLEVDLVISILLCATLVNFLNKVIRTALLQ